jgi:hypothetical protein
MKQQVKSIIETFIANAQESYPSIYSKDDVVKLLNDMLVKVDELEDVEEQEQGTYTKEQIANAIDEMRTDTIVDLDYSSADFDLDGNEISVNDMDYEVDTNELRINLFKVLDRN